MAKLVGLSGFHHLLLKRHSFTMPPKKMGSKAATVAIAEPVANEEVSQTIAGQILNSPSFLSLPPFLERVVLEETTTL
jgi:hypothetical protein